MSSYAEPLLAEMFERALMAGRDKHFVSGMGDAQCWSAEQIAMLRANNQGLDPWGQPSNGPYLGVWVARKGGETEWCPYYSGIKSKNR